MDPPALDAATLLSAYAQGAFPMTDPGGAIRWYTADPRGVLPLDQFHCPKNLARTVRQRKFDVRINHNFEATMRGCMLVRRETPEGTWISDELIAAYIELSKMGYAHSVESWLGGKLVGGLYGVSLGAAFFGESMFHSVTDASKVALVHLVHRLRERDFLLLDTQMVTSHMRQFGAIEIRAADYHASLARALEHDRSFS